MTSPHGVKVSFTCKYDTTVSVASGPFVVEDLSIIDRVTGNGDLSSGFSLSLTQAGGNGRYILGAVQGVEIEWSVTDFTGFSFTVNECSVVDKESSVAVVKDSVQHLCYTIM